MTTYGVQPTGWVAKTLAQCLADAETDLQGVFGPNVNLDPGSSVLGVLAGIMAERFAELWAQGQAIYSAFDPAAAQNAQADAIAALTGTKRIAASPSTTILTCAGDPGTVITSGSVAKDSAGNLWRISQAGTLVYAGSWAGGEVRAVGDRRTANGAVFQIVQVENDMTTGSVAPTPGNPGDRIVDNNVVWITIGQGTASIDLPAACTVNGPTVGLAYTILTINTPITGWDTVGNQLDASEGTNVETDAFLRLRREEELQGGGNAAVQAIRAAVLLVKGVTSCTVFANNTDTAATGTVPVDVPAGQPPHSVQCLVQGGADADVRTAILSSIAAGITAYGNVTGTVTDSQGLIQEIDFSRPVPQNVYVFVNVYVDSTFPSDGAAEIIAAILAWSLTLKSGQDVTASKVGASFGGTNPDGTPIIPGVQDYDLPHIGLAPSPLTSAKIPITTLQLAVFESNHIVINTTTWVP